MVSLNEREQHEVNHGKYLIESGNPELLWNWDTSAGRWRANRRGRLLRETAKLKPGQRVMEVGCARYTDPNHPDFWQPEWAKPN